MAVESARAGADHADGLAAVVDGLVVRATIGCGSPDHSVVFQATLIQEPVSSFHAAPLRRPGSPGALDGPGLPGRPGWAG